MYQEIAAHNPQTMGKSKACYSGLLHITSIYAKLAHSILLFARAASPRGRLQSFDMRLLDR